MFLHMAAVSAAWEEQPALSYCTELRGADGRTEPRFRRKLESN